MSLQFSLPYILYLQDSSMPPCVHVPSGAALACPVPSFLNMRCPQITCRMNSLSTVKDRVFHILKFLEIRFAHSTSPCHRYVKLITQKLGLKNIFYYDVSPIEGFLYITSSEKKGYFENRTERDCPFISIHLIQTTHIHKLCLWTSSSCTVEEYNFELMSKRRNICFSLCYRS